MLKQVEVSGSRLHEPVVPELSRRVDEAAIGGSEHSHLAPDLIRIPLVVGVEESDKQASVSLIPRLNRAALMHGTIAATGQSWHRLWGLRARDSLALHEPISHTVTANAKFRASAGARDGGPEVRIPVAFKHVAMARKRWASEKVVSISACLRASRGVASWCKIVESRVRMSCQWVHKTRGVRMRQTRRPLKPTTTGVWKPGFQQCS